MSKGNSYYELHITMVGDKEECRRAVNDLGPQWRFSSIDGDANLGDGVKHYATRQASAKNPSGTMVELLLTAAEQVSRSQGVREVARRKVELVIYDDRSSKVRAACNGACPECHSNE